MTLRVAFRKSARAEFDADADYYEQQRPGLGEDFIDAIDTAISRAAANPERCAVVIKNVQRIVVRRFPYTVFFRVRNSRLIDLSVFHSSRNPAIWQQRI